jgi:hypothetical protein
MLRTLIENGADVNARGGALLEKAVLKKEEDFVRILIENDAEITKQALTKAMSLDPKPEGKYDATVISILKMLKDKITSILNL